MNINPRWLSLTEASKYASMCKKTMARYVASGDIYASRKGGKWFVDKESIDAFFMADKVTIKELLARVRR
jgi:predicted site-specific integrase-resolvase